MAYKAIHDIGEYKKGDVVPDEKAIQWNEMFEDQPCRLDSESVQETEEVTEEVVQVPKSKGKKK